MAKQKGCTRAFPVVRTVQGMVLLMIGAAIGISFNMKIHLSLVGNGMHDEATTSPMKAMIEQTQDAGSGQPRSSRRLDLFVNIAPAQAVEATTGCMNVSTNMTLDLATKSCNGHNCPACAIFPYDAGGALPVTLTLQNCSTAFVGAAKQLGGPSVFANAMMDFRFVNLRTVPVKVATGSAMPVCTYAGREFYTINKGAGQETACGHGITIGGGPLSIAFTLRFDALYYFGKAVHLESGADYIKVAQVSTSGLVTTTNLDYGYKDSTGAAVSERLIDAIVLGETNRYLMTIGSGFLKVYKDGVVIVSKATATYPARKLWTARIGNSAGNNNGFDGLVQDLWVFDSEVAWEDAVYEGYHIIPGGRSAQASCVTLGASGSTKAANRLVFDDTRVVTGK